MHKKLYCKNILQLPSFYILMGLFLFLEIETPLDDELMDTNASVEDGLPATENSAVLDETLADPLLTENQTSLEATTEGLTDTVAELDPEIRLALGDPVEEIPTYGENIHADIAKRWLPILRQGLTKDIKEKLLKEHSAPDNCRLLKAPTLNPEISAAVAEVVRSRDKKLETKQGQLGLGITAISKAMSKLLDNGPKVEVIKLLSEGCRILSDLHYTETQTRSKLITPCLDKAFLTIIQDENRDDTLFGIKLSEKIKSAKVIEKQGLQIKRNAPSTAAGKSTLPQQTPARRQAGNWQAPTRYPTSANRGGRGGYTASRPAPSTTYRKYSAQAQPPPPASASTAQTRQTTSRQRAPTRQ